jgi:hypothetical protein
VAAIAAKKNGPSLSTDKGVALAPSKEDLSPWYSSKTGERSMEDGSREKEAVEEKRYVLALCVHFRGSGSHYSVSFYQPP